MDAARKTIEQAWENRDALRPGAAPRALRDAVELVIAGLDSGRLRVAERLDGAWTTHQWIKKAVLLSFRLEDNRLMPGAFTSYDDKVPSKFAHFDAAQFAAGGESHTMASNSAASSSSNRASAGPSSSSWGLAARAPGSGAKARRIRAAPARRREQRRARSRSWPPDPSRARQRRARKSRTRPGAAPRCAARRRHRTPPAGRHGSAEGGRPRGRSTLGVRPAAP